MLGLGLALSIAKKTLGDAIDGLLSTLRGRATYYENGSASKSTIKAIDNADVLDKATILLTPTATSDARVHSVKTYTGDELVTNGTFDTDSDWTKGTGWSIANGVASYDNLGTASLTQTFTWESGKTYEIQFEVSDFTSNYRFDLYSGSSFIQSAIVTDKTTWKIYFVGDGGNTMRFRGLTTESFSIDNISVVDVSSDFDFDRASSATRINSSANIEDITSDLPRINYDSNGDNGHILLEPTSTNLVTYSENFDETTSDWINNNVSVELNSTISPQGISNAAKITEDTSNDTHRLQFYFSQTINTNYSYSIFVKANGRNYCGMNIGASRLFANFDLINGTVTRVSSNGTDFNNESASITAFGNGWYKCTLSGYALTTNGGYIRFALRNILSTSSSLSYLGDGTSGAYIWGAQLEALSYSTSYIPTLTGSTVTRATETLTGSGNSTLINSTEGVLYAEIAALANDGIAREITLNDGTEDNRVIVSYNTSNQIRINYRKSGSNIFDQTHTTTTTDYNKIAIKWELNSFRFYVNGTQIASSSSGAVMSANTLNTIDFDNYTGSFKFNGKCKALAVFNEALSDTELQNLTS